MEDEDGSNEEDWRRQLLSRLLADYEHIRGNSNIEEDHDISRDSVASQMLSKLNAADNDSDACLICLERIDVAQAVWSCRSCYEMYHLSCIQKWSLQACLDRTQPDQPGWQCPKCRHHYDDRARPTLYECFCGSIVDPPNDQWTTPHSCGGTCRRVLDSCSHSCLLLCHPCPCPPCPQVPPGFMYMGIGHEEHHQHCYSMLINRIPLIRCCQTICVECSSGFQVVRTRCFCGSNVPEARRCGRKNWSCGRVCDRLLHCEYHRCKSICHDGQCGICDRDAQRSCVCGRKSAIQQCSQADWSCAQICDKLLECRQHSCQLVCHSGPCPPCVSPGSNSCPCGKCIYQGRGCRNELPCCGDTCAKELDCGTHRCIQQCHRGPCPSCNQERMRTCRCGIRQKSVACNKVFLCETKCRKTKPCGRHACSKKCCDGKCPPCELTCNRPLSCGHHKCPSPCHQGPCYPCPQIADVKCACKLTILRVPCGLQRKTKPPKCTLLCPKKSDCHHDRRPAHRCHFGDCPPCTLTCSKKLACSHTCPRPCHDAVLVDVNAPSKDFRPITPLDCPIPQLRLIALPCPPCVRPVPVTCRGTHLASSFPCHSRPSDWSCGGPCDRLSVCGNHNCPESCHDVETDQCPECDQTCSLPRPLGCTHACPLPCHQSPCPACRLPIRQLCHCSLNIVYSVCSQWTNMTDEQKSTKLCCGNACPQLLDCGHQCSFSCHDGKCSKLGSCQKMVLVQCKCGCLSETQLCSNKTSISCSSKCQMIKKTRQPDVEVKSTKTTNINENDKMSYQNVGSRRSRKNKGDCRQISVERDDQLLRYRIMIATILIIPIAVIIWFLFFM